MRLGGDNGPSPPGWARGPVLSDIQVKMLDTQPYLSLDKIESKPVAFPKKER